MRVHHTLLLTAWLLHHGVAAGDRMTIPGGPFQMGSTAEEREYGYRLDEERGSDIARRHAWFANETRRRPNLPAFTIDRHPVTQGDYATFVAATGHPPPDIDRTAWTAQGLLHPYATVERFRWRDGTPPPGRHEHPVALVTRDDAAAYCRWRGRRDDVPLALPDEAQWEKAARGADGRRFPWGDTFEARRLNSADAGPYDTEPVGMRPQGYSPYGVGEMAGMVFEWTGTPCPGDATRAIVKGGSWDDLPGVTRSAARHCRPLDLRHVLVGFRCAGPATEE